MTDEAKLIVEALREDAEWAHANEWETPITLGDHLEAAADLIESLSAELERAQALAEARLKRKNMYRERSARSLFEKIALENELRKVKRERDAAVEDMKIHKFCHHCVEGDRESERCYSCDHKCNWQWRGAREDEK